LFGTYEEEIEKEILFFILVAKERTIIVELVKACFEPPLEVHMQT
jgi:hypothetical protein